jgi:hypothetical protein
MVLEMSYDGRRLNYLFNSERTSSFFLFDIFRKNKAVAKDFIKECFHLDADKIAVHNEYSTGKGPVDLVIKFNVNSSKCILLIEVKVHDDSSVTKDQIIRYYDAILDSRKFDKIYFIYLTQFNRDDDFTNSAEPKSLAEAKRGKEHIGEKFLHKTWNDVHAFLEYHKSKLNPEQQAVLDLHSSWIREKEKDDLASYAREIGKLRFEDILGDADDHLSVLKSLGDIEQKKDTEVLIIDVFSLSDKERNDMFDAIHGLSRSDFVNRNREYRTRDQTRKAAAAFLSNLAKDYEWDLLRLYSGLFHRVHETRYLQLFGKSDLSIKFEPLHPEVKEISLCRIWKQGKFHFRLKR